MRVAICWIRGLTEKALEFSIHYHAHQDLDELREFWGGTLGIDADAIRLQGKSNSNQLTGRCWRSRIASYTSVSTTLCFRARLQAWMDYLRSEWQ